MTTLLLAVLKPGDHIVMTSDLYRRRRQFVVTVLNRYLRLIEVARIAALCKAYGRVKLIVDATLASPTSPGAGSGRRDSNPGERRSGSDAATRISRCSAIRSRATRSTA